MADKLTTSLMKTVLASSGMQAQLIAALMEMLASIWGGFEDWYEPDGVQRAAKLAAEAEAAALTQVRRAASSTARELLRQTGETITIDPLEALEHPRGVDPLELWERPAEAYRYAISQGKNDTEALAAAMNRAGHIAKADVVITARDAQIREFRRSEKVKGYRRVIHPELSKSGVCGMCIVAADRLYSLKELMPLHDGCNCTVAPVTARSDPGLKLNQQDLEELYSAAGGSTRKEDLARLRITSYEHGELGPTLVRVGQSYLSPEEAAARKRPPKRHLRAVNSSSDTALRKKKNRNAAETQRLLDTSQKKLDAYQKAIDEAKAAGKTPDDITIRGYVYGLQRERKNVLSYTKELKAA